MPVALRELEREDWPRLRELRLHALRAEPGLFFSSFDAEAGHNDEHWMKLAGGDDQHQLFGLFAGEKLVGISGVFTDRDDPTGRTAALGMSYILPEYRGQGFASRLYEARLAWARARPNFLRAVVGHRLSNEPSRRAIARFGFTWTETKPYSWPDGTDEEHVGYELILRDD